MKRWADQLDREKVGASTLETVKVTRVNAPFVDSFLRMNGDFACVLAVKRAGDGQHNYAMKLEAVEADEIGLGKQSEYRELMPDWRRREEEAQKKRVRATEYLARQIAAGMLDYLEKNDPQFGYTPEQWREMNSHATP